MEHLFMTGASGQPAHACSNPRPISLLVSESRPGSKIGTVETRVRSPFSGRIEGFLAIAASA